MPRRIINSSAYTIATDCLVYVHCMMRANTQDTVVRGVYLKRGEFLTSIADLAAECGLSKDQIRRPIERLKRDTMITVRSAPCTAHKRGTIITVVDYGDFDVTKPTSHTTTDQIRDSVTGITTAQQYKNKNKSKKEEQEEENKDTRDHSCGMIGQPEEKKILNHMFKTGFVLLKTENKHILTIRQLLKEGYNPETIMEEVDAVVDRSKDQEQEPIRDALAYLVVRLNRSENGWSYEDNETLNEE